MAGIKPRFKITVKGKNSDNKASIAAIWQRENGMLGGQFDDDVEYIMLKDGRKITNENVWVNMWDNDKETPKPSAKPSAKPEPTPESYDDIPF